MTQTRDLIKKMADFFKSEEYYEKGEDARLELSPDDVRCMNEVIKACRNSVNRQAVLDQTYLWSKDEFLRVTNPFDYLRKRINSLPPVTPQTGHWRHYEGMLTCSECRAEFYDDIMEYCGDDVPKCCPDCGTRMIKPNMSEIPTGSKPEISSYYGLKSYARKRSDNDEN